MKKIVFSLAALAAISTSAFALTLEEFVALENPEHQTVYGPNSPSVNRDEAAFAAVQPDGDSISSGSSYQKTLKLRMRENPEHY